MTVDEMIEFWDTLEWSNFKISDLPVERQRGTKKRDLHAFLLLDSLFPDSYESVDAAEHDVIFLGVSAEELAEKASTEDLIELNNCGVHYEPDFDCICMYK